MSKKKKPQPGRDEKGRFLIGNKFWEERGENTGARFVSEWDAPRLKEALYNYIQHNNDHPHIVEEAVKFQGVGKVMQMRKERPLTIIGFCNHIGILMQTWLNWKKDRSDLLDIIGLAEQIFTQHKFDGAASGIFNANIIARDLGLADKQEQKVEVDGLTKLMDEIRDRKGE